MLFHYWKLGNFILYYQKRLGWGGKVINQISKAIKMSYPEKKGYSARNLTYMCQFARIFFTGSFTENAFLRCGIEKSDNRQSAVCNKDIGQLSICAGSSCVNAIICKSGKWVLYINIVDEQLRGENDNKTIGLLLCKGKDEVVAQYALTGYAQPMGVSDYQLSKAIPENLKSALPSVEEVEEELSQLLDNKKTT